MTRALAQGPDPPVFKFRHGGHRRSPVGGPSPIGKGVRALVGGAGRHSTRARPPATQLLSICSLLSVVSTARRAPRPASSTPAARRARPSRCARGPRRSPAPVLRACARPMKRAGGFRGEGGEGGGGQQRALGEVVSMRARTLVSVPGRRIYRTRT